MREEVQRAHGKAKEGYLVVTVIIWNQQSTASQCKAKEGYLEGHSILSCRTGQLFEKAFWKLSYVSFPAQSRIK